MPPKPQVFKTPDGKEFATRVEWRDYMMQTFYSWKDRNNEPEPLIKYPGDIDGQMFDIGDCENTTMAIMDNCEQVQMDQLKNCRVFIGACASSIFIRNCENCVFYTSCRQLRLREVTNSKFYIYSMAEVHIEYSNGLQFAPFNGGYPDQEKHFRNAQLDPANNLWYDIFDHNDPNKTHANWSLLPESEYEEPWFPAGEPCEPAVPRTKAGSVPRPDLDTNQVGQAFGVQQMIDDAAKLAAAPPPLPSPKKVAAPPIVVSSPIVEETPPPLPPANFEEPAIILSDEEKVVSVMKLFVSGNDISSITSSNFSYIQPTSLSVKSEEIVSCNNEIWNIEQLVVASSGTSAWSMFWVNGDGCFKVTGIFEKSLCGNWKLIHAHRSLAVGDDSIPKTFSA